MRFRSCSRQRRPGPTGRSTSSFATTRCEWTTGDATRTMMGLGGIAAPGGLRRRHVNYLSGNCRLLARHRSSTSTMHDKATTMMPGVWRLFPRGSGISAVCGGKGTTRRARPATARTRSRDPDLSELCEADVPCADPQWMRPWCRDAAVVRRDANVMLRTCRSSARTRTATTPRGRVFHRHQLFPMDSGDEMDASIDMDAAVDAGPEPDAWRCRHACTDIGARRRS